MELATFAGGCFWCMVTPFEELPGIRGIVSGYMGGEAADPTYEQVKTGTTGHLEVVQIRFDPDRFPYERQRELAEASRDALAAGGRFDRPIVTAIRPAEVFYPAEDYHQSRTIS